MKLLGRRAECEFLDAALADALDGRSRVVVLRGEAGAGKSAVLDFVVERSDGFPVATASGSNRRWSSPTVGCTSSVHRCWIISVNCRSRSAMHWERFSACSRAQPPTVSWSGSQP